METYNQRVYRERKELGLCVGCGKFPPVTNRVRCPPCLQVAAEWNRKHHAKRTPEQKKAFAKRMRKYMDDPENRARWNELNRQRNQALRLETMAAYGGVCGCCGEDTIEFLTLDHVNNDGIEHCRKLGYKGKVTGITFYKKLRKMGFPKDFKLKVLCYNCHMAKDKFGGCPHQARKKRRAKR